MIFTQVFQASGTGKNGKPYTRWDYKTADGERFAHFAGTQEIPLNTDVAVELSASGSIREWKTTGASVSAGNTQPTADIQNGYEAARTAPTGSQRDFQAEAEGKTRCALVSALLPALFTAQVEAGQEPSPDNARILLEWAFTYVFQTDLVPF